MSAIVTSTYTRKTHSIRERVSIDVPAEARDRGWKEADKRDAVVGNGEIAIVYRAMLDHIIKEAGE